MGKKIIDGTRISNAYNVDPDTLVIIGLDTEDGDEHPLYDPRVHLPLDENFVRNVMSEGVLQAISVRKNGDAVEVVAGRQRVRAAREANKRFTEAGKIPLTVPCILYYGTDALAFGVLISENENRRNDGPLQKAEKAARFLTMNGSVEECAIKFGVTVQTIYNWRDLLQCDVKVRNAVGKGLIRASAAAPLAKLSREEQREALLELLDGNGKATAAKAAHVVKRKKAGENADSVVKAPGKKVLKRLVANFKTADETCEVPEDVIKGIRIAMGWLPITSVKGLKALGDAE